MILPIGIVPTESCESHFLINEHERHFCVTVSLSTTFRDSLLSQFHKKKVINFVITVKLTRTNRRYRSHFVRHCCRNQKSRRGQGFFTRLSEPGRRDELLEQSALCALTLYWNGRLTTCQVILAYDMFTFFGPAKLLSEKICIFMYFQATKLAFLVVRLLRYCTQTSFPILRVWLLTS